MFRFANREKKKIFSYKMGSNVNESFYRTPLPCFAPLKVVKVMSAY